MVYSQVRLPPDESSCVALAPETATNRWVRKLPLLNFTHQLEENPVDYLTSHAGVKISSAADQRNGITKEEISTCVHGSSLVHPAVLAP
jgi:hypothetical protein